MKTNLPRYQIKTLVSDRYYPLADSRQQVIVMYASDEAPSAYHKVESTDD